MTNEDIEALKIIISTYRKGITQDSKINFEQSGVIKESLSPVVVQTLVFINELFEIMINPDKENQLKLFEEAENILISRGCNFTNKLVVLVEEGEELKCKKELAKLLHIDILNDYLHDKYEKLGELKAVGNFIEMEEDVEKLFLVLHTNMPILEEQEEDFLKIIRYISERYTEVNGDKPQVRTLVALTRIYLINNLQEKGRAKI